MNSVTDWEELSRETILEKYGRGLEKVMFRLPDGKEREFYLKKEGNAICALAVTKADEVILTKQFRPGPKKILFELPGGGMQKGESPEDAIARELLEETGYAGKVQFVTRLYSCAYSSQHRHCFVVTECEKVAEQSLDEEEFVETILVSLQKFREILRSGNMTDVASGYLGLDFLRSL